MITNINGLDVKIIKKVLTNVEVDYIVKTVVDIYFEKEDFENIPYSPLTARTNFYSLLFQLCVEDYDGEDIKKYNELYEHDVQGYILSKIRNASEAKKLIEESIKLATSISGVIEKYLSKFMDLMTQNTLSSSDINKALNQLPADWKKVYGEFMQITGQTSKETQN